MNRATRYPNEVRERAVSLVFEHEREYDSQWAAISSISAKLGMTAETLRKWVRAAETGQGPRPGLTTTERERLKQLERENRELRRANEILKVDGSLWAWGRNVVGQLGLGDADGRRRPARVPVEGEWASVSNGGDHALGIKHDGSLWGWARIEPSPLGFHDFADREGPTRVGPDDDWAAAACGWNHTVALKRAGSLWAWSSGELRRDGLADEASRDHPVRIGSDSDWVAISAGDGWALALRRSGSLWAWGRNSCGQLGLGDDAFRSEPTRVLLPSSPGPHRGVRDQVGQSAADVLPTRRPRMAQHCGARLGIETARNL